jgi:hypothetical protein
MRGIDVIFLHCCLLSLNSWNAYIKERMKYLKHLHEISIFFVNSRNIDIDFSEKYLPTAYLNSHPNIFIYFRFLTSQI